MATLIGILCDVSASMRENATGKVKDKEGKWVRSIFTVIDDLIQHDVSGNNHVFAVAVGAICGSEIFDVLGTIDQVQTESSNEERNLTYSQIVEETFLILEKNGAYSIRKWAKEDVIRSVLSYDMALLILNKLKCDMKFVTYFVHTCLPQICRDIPKAARVGVAGVAAGLSAVLVPFPFSIVAVAVTYTLTYNGQKIVDSAITGAGKNAKEQDIIEVVEKAKCFFLRLVDENCITSVQKASDIIHGYVDEKDLSDDRVSELLKTVEPFIYGRTPLFKALEVTQNLFSMRQYNGHKKMLFVMSDGEPTDEGNLFQIISQLNETGVSVVTCYISKSEQVSPKRLYSSPQLSWDEHANFLFKLSSIISTQLLPRSIFVKRHWEIDITNNETKLFLHVNHPDILKDACDLARNVVCSQDALSELLTFVSLDIYINLTTNEFEVQNQDKDTCYANASATALHLSMMRILGREGGYPDFNTLREEIIKSYGDTGDNTLRVLEKVCPRYRLRCSQTEVAGAMEAITEKRPVVATFALTKAEWKIFHTFFRDHPTDILTKFDLCIKRPIEDKLYGHAVVLTSFNSKCLQFMNSWGNDWGDLGFFRTENASVLDLEFVDVFWTPHDLTDSERAYYKKYGAEVADKLIHILKSLQTAEYQCPECGRILLVTEFTGTLLKANCPKCYNTFDCHKAGNILAINMYLLSLSR